VGAPDAILGDAASFILAGALIAAIPSFDQSRAARWAERAANPASTTRNLVAGLAYTWQHPVPRGLLIYWSASIAAVPIALVAAIPYVTRVLGASSFDYGVAVACYAVGSIAGSLISGKLKFRGGKRAWLLTAGLTYGGVNVVILGHPPFLAFCLLWVIWGLAYGPEEVITNIIGYLAEGELTAHIGAAQSGSFRADEHEADDEQESAQ
jgi:Na+/melibiose symporter-like transporter